MKRNFLSGVAASVWSAFVGLAVVPLYLKYLGTEAYGLIGFFATTQALLQLLDLGLAPTINREVARCSATGVLHEANKLLHTLAVVYWIAAVAIASGIILAAPFIAGHWLQSKALTQETVTHAIMLMGVVVACRWPGGIYSGVLLGLQKISLSSAVTMFSVTLSSLGAVVVLAFFSPTIEAFFLWQACAGLANVMVTRWLARKLLRAEGERGHFDLGELKRIWRFSAGMSGVAVTGVILMQMDKVLLSRILSLEDFGRYTLSVVVANGLYILLTPLFNTIYPRMSALVAAGETEKLLGMYRLSTRFFLGLLFPVAITAAVFSEELLRLWTRNPELAESSALIVSLFLVGTALNGVMHFPYALQLAYGSTKLPLKINMILIVVMVPMTIILSLSFGAVGGAASWALLNGIYVLVGTWLTHRSLLKGLGVKWLFGDVAVPLLVAALFAGAMGMLVRHYVTSILVGLVLGGILVCASFAVTVLVSPALKTFLRNNLGVRVQQALLNK